MAVLMVGKEQTVMKVFIYFTFLYCKEITNDYKTILFKIPLNDFQSFFKIIFSETSKK